MTLAEQIAALDAAERSATPGPWDWKSIGPSTGTVRSPEGFRLCRGAGLIVAERVNPCDVGVILSRNTIRQLLEWMEKAKTLLVEYSMKKPTRNMSEIDKDAAVLLAQLDSPVQKQT